MAHKLINPTKKVDRKSFADFLAANPDLAEELADALNDMVHSSTETGKVSEKVMANLATLEGPKAEMRRVEFVGPQVGKELASDGAMALLLVIGGIVILMYLPIFQLGQVV